MGRTFFECSEHLFLKNTFDSTVMNFYDVQVVFQEVPNEISLCFSISGCPIRCKGCHSPFLWKKNSGKELSIDLFKTELSRYKGLATCVVFMGGDWEESALIELLQEAKFQQFKTCLYSGSNEVSLDLKKVLTYIKVGPWIPEKGGLDSASTNQKFIEVASGRELNHLFIKN